MIYTAQYKMLLMRQHPLREQVGGVWALDIKNFWHRADTRVLFGAQRDFQGPTPPTCPSHGFARIKRITYRALSIGGS
jgi:hypothetical protein